MDTQKVELFLSTRAKYFEADQSGSIREILLGLNDSQMSGNHIPETGFREGLDHTALGWIV